MKYNINEILFNIGQLSTAISWLPGPGHNYDIFEYEGKKYLRQLEFKSWKQKEISIEKFSKNKSIIIDLIDTANFNNTINWNNCSSYISERKLLKWCYNYGLPLRNSQQDGRMIIDDKPSVDYSSFCTHIVQMRCVFNLWLGLIGEDIDILIKNISFLVNCPFLNRGYFFGMSYKDIINFYSKNMEQINDFNKTKIICCHIMQEIFNNELKESCFLKVESPFCDSEIFNPNNPILEIMTYCELLDLCYYQLYAIVTSKEGTKHLKECENPECKNLFWCHDKRQKYCPNCDRRKLWYKNKKEGKEQ